MVTLKDGRPLISWPLASTVIGMLLVPSIAAFWTLSATLTQLRGDADQIKAGLLQLRAETYTRAEAQLQFQRLDGVDTYINTRVGDAHARIDSINQRGNYPSERPRNELMRSIQIPPRTAVDQVERLMKPQ